MNFKFKKNVKGILSVLVGGNALLVVNLFLWIKKIKLNENFIVRQKHRLLHSYPAFIWLLYGVSRWTYG
jgi:hypothetical protein